MKKNYFFLLTVATFALASCSSDDAQVGNNNDTPAEIRINTSIGQLSVTRATETTYDSSSGGIQETALDGDLITNSTPPAVYICKDGKTAKTNDYFYKNIDATAIGAGGALTTGSTVFYFPQDKTAVDVYVYAPHQNDVTELSSASSGGIQFSIQTDQSTKANYLKSDFVFGKADVAYSSSNATASVTMQHALSKIIFKIKRKDNTTDISDLTQAEISNISPDVTISMDAISTSLPASVGTASGTPTTVYLAKSTGDTRPTDYSTEDVCCIVPPQTLNSDVTLTFSGQTYTTSSKVTTTLDAGNSYTYNITLDQSNLEITSVTITSWTNTSNNINVQ